MSIEKDLARYRKNKDTVWRRLGNKCSHPGCDCTENLQLDHKDPLTKEYDVTPRLSGRLAPLWDEIYKCQLLCEKHHKEKNLREMDIIQKKRKEFCSISPLHYVPLLDEWQKTFTIDDKKKDGRALIKLLKHISEETGRSYDAVLRRYWMDIEFTKDLELLRDWDNIKWTEDATQEEIDYFKSHLTEKMEKVKKLFPKAYKYQVDYFEEMEYSQEGEKQINYSKVIDKMINHPNAKGMWSDFFDKTVPYDEIIKDTA
tara:strand:+ start:369 stop:1139 length:771 start_codon:yes stop_codon:yes gene_type:complete